MSSNVRALLFGTVVLPGILASAFAQDPPDGVDALIGRIRTLVRLKGMPYIKERDRTLEVERNLDSYRKVANRSDDWHVKLLCDAFVLRLEKPDIAALLDRDWQRPGGRVFGIPTPRSRDAPYLDQDYADIVTSCFGAEAFPVLAENLLHAGLRSEYYPRCDGSLMDALVEMRDERVVDVFLHVLAKWQDPPKWVRLHQAWKLGELLGGLRARKEILSPKAVGRHIPNQLRPYHGPIELPELTIEGRARKRVLEALEEVLLSDEDGHVRAMAAWALQYGDETVVLSLTKALKSDGSPWTKAWCAFSLRKIVAVCGDKTIELPAEPPARPYVKTVKELADRALELSRRAEAELIAVIDGICQPRQPASGINGYTFLQDDSEWKKGHWRLERASGPLTEFQRALLTGEQLDALDEAYAKEQGERKALSQKPEPDLRPEPPREPEAPRPVEPARGFGASELITGLIAGAILGAVAVAVGRRRRKVEDRGR